MRARAMGVFVCRTEEVARMQAGTGKEPRERRMATTLTLPPATWDKLRKMASERASSVSRVVEQLVEQEDAHDANRDPNG